MTTTASIVPTLTRADLLALHAFNATHERTRREYERTRDALNELERHVTPCFRCRTERHDLCNGRGGRSGAHRCACWLLDHTDDTRRTA